MHYLELLRRLHEEIRPAGYLEIGVDCGDSLGLSRARSVAIDPAPKPRPQSLLGKPGLILYVGTSDDFFREHARGAMLGAAPLDLAFIDGLHQFAQVVRDLEHIERWGHAYTVVAIHDVLPRNAWEAAHVFHDGFWTGDVWRIVPFLQRHRPDLRLWLTQAEPTGMLIVTGLDPAHPGMSALAETEDAAVPPPGPAYDRLVQQYIASAAAEPAETVVHTLGIKRRLTRDWEYQTKWGMRQIAASSWQPLLDAATALVHTDQRQDGMRACLRLIEAHWLAQDVRDQAYELLAAYAQPLHAIWPESSLHPLPSSGGAENASFLGLAADAEEMEALVETQGENEETPWRRLRLDHALRLLGEETLRDETYVDAPAAVTPATVEEMHPIVWDGRLHALVTVRDRNPRGIAQTGVATIDDGALCNLRLLSDPGNGRHERHWSPFLADDGLHAITCWEPTETQRIDAAAGTGRRAALRLAPRLAERFEGASPGVRVPGGWLFLVNEPAGGDGAMAFARFVFLRANFEVAAMSPHFWVAARGEDRASGLTRLGDDLIVGFTRRRRAAILARIPVADVLPSLLPLALAGPASSDAESKEGGATV